MDPRSTAEIGVLGGTGLYDMDDLEDAHDIEMDTPFGKPSAPFRLGVLGGRRVAFLARHGAGHALLPSEIPYRANVFAMKLLGVSKCLSVGAVGSLREDLPPRTLVVPDQFLDRTRHRADTFFGEGAVAHVSMAEPFAPALRRVLVAAARARGHEVADGGTYLCMEGPQFSTRAESLWYRSLGCSVIGMTNLTEARLCREAEIAYATLSLVTDFEDRKSTRLNSSHSQISYAVFCLKKKTTHKAMLRLNWIARLTSDASSSCARASASWPPAPPIVPSCTRAQPASRTRPPRHSPHSR